MTIIFNKVGASFASNPTLELHRLAEAIAVDLYQSYPERFTT